MGKCGEDGQTVMFEATTELAGDVFCELETDAWVSRLAHVCGDVHAIYTRELGPDFRQVASDVSRIFGAAYYALVCDETAVDVWRNGEHWLGSAPYESIGRTLEKHIEACIFLESNRKSGGTLWRVIHDFVWADFFAPGFLLEK